MYRSLVRVMQFDVSSTRSMIPVVKIEMMLAWEDGVKRFLCQPDHTSKRTIIHIFDSEIGSVVATVAVLNVQLVTAITTAAIVATVFGSGLIGKVEAPTIGAGRTPFSFSCFLLPAYFKNTKGQQQW